MEIKKEIKINMKLYYKFIIFWLLFSVRVYGSTKSMQQKYFPYPVPRNNYINDYARLLTKNDARTLYNKLKDFDGRTNTKIVIVTIPSFRNYKIKEQSMKSFATGLFNKWGIGDKNKNNGVLILVSKKDRKCYIELGGYYSERYNSIMKEIIEKDMIPSFKNGNYSHGICEGTDRVMEKVTKKVSWASFHKWHILIGLLVFVFILAGISYMRSGKVGWGWKLFAAIIATMGLFLTILSFGENRRDSLWWRFGLNNDDYDDDSSFGDGLDFGGGSSFGGGASGSW